MLYSYRTTPMTVNFEIKGMLAKLLATEDIIVEHKKVDTACFNVHTRCLTLPLWEKASDNVYNLLCAHEVGHARETPDIDWSKKSKIPKQYINIVEDARVEKLMKRRYNGLSKTFYIGYKELLEDDFFSIGDEDVSKYSLADRVNLYFKIGNFLPIPFNEKENEVVQLVSDAETFDDALKVAKILYEYTKEEVNYKESDSDAASTKVGQSNGESSNNMVELEEQNDQDDGDENEESSGSSSMSQPTDERGDAKGDDVKVAPTSSTSKQKEKEPEIKTVDSLDKKIKELASEYTHESKYIEIPDLNLDTVIASNTDIHKEITDCFNHQLSLGKTNLFKGVDTEYQKFKISAQKEVNYLLKEFECRKSADAYSRSSMSRTGVLDTARLHSYKFSDDIFKKITVIPEGKNHGLIFILDWSGSMQNILLDTCKQLFNLIWFCRKASIPFEVYAFTSEWMRPSYNYNTHQYIHANFKPHYTPKDGLVAVESDFSLMNLLTSKIPTSKLEVQMKNIWRVVSYWNRYKTSSFTIPNKLTLSGTPLNESLIALHKILPKFQKENKLQKVHTIVLTDGEANSLAYHVEVKSKTSNEVRLGLNSVRAVRGSNYYLRDRKLGTMYKIYNEYHCPYHEFTNTLLRNLKDKFPDVNFIGYRILEGGNSFRGFVDRHYSTDQGSKEYQQVNEDWKKNKSFSIKISGYDVYFGLSSNTLSQEGEFEVSETATKTQIKTAFNKSLKTKKMNKKILSEFVTLIV